MRYDITQQEPEYTVIYPGSNSFMAMTSRNGDLYLADYSAGKIGKLRLSDNNYSTYITNVANCSGLTFTPNGRLLVTLAISNKVVSWDGEGLMTVIQNLVNQPTAIEADASGNIYLAFWSGSKIRKYASNYSSYTEVSGNTTGSVAILAGSNGFYFTDRTGDLYAPMASATISGTLRAHNQCWPKYGNHQSIWRRIKQRKNFLYQRI